MIAAYFFQNTVNEDRRSLKLYSLKTLDAHQPQSPCRTYMFTGSLGRFTDTFLLKMFTGTFEVHGHFFLKVFTGILEIHGHFFDGSRALLRFTGIFFFLYSRAHAKYSRTLLWKCSRALFWGSRGKKRTLPLGGKLFCVSAVRLRAYSPKPSGGERSASVCLRALPPNPPPLPREPSPHTHRKTHTQTRNL